MEFVGNFIQITVPRKLHAEAGGGPLSSLLVAATKCAGGLTIQEAQGTWFDGDGVEYAEQVYLLRWNFGNDKHKEMRAHRDAIVQRMFELGEKAVLVERYSDRASGNGYSADIYEA